MLPEGQMQNPTRLGISTGALIDTARTTIAVLISVLAARHLNLPEYYWAPISTIVIMQSTLDPLTLGWQRFAGTALGAVLAALIAQFFGFHVLAYAAGVFVCGLLCWVLRIGAAYRFAAITMSIVLLISHASSPWIVGWHRFIEVSLGIAVALLVSVTWPRPKVAY
jgi:uncharacterized membrane protein YgaE (UPF0421/DUF939 family)